MDALEGTPSVSIKLPSTIVTRLNAEKRTIPEEVRARGQRRMETVADVISRLLDEHGQARA